MKPEIHQLTALKDNYVYLVHDPKTDCCLVIDPTISGPVLNVLQQKKWKLTHILNTHHHWDHTDGNLELKTAIGCVIIGSDYDVSRGRIPGAARGVQDGDTIAFGTLCFQVIFVPGHTLGHCIYYCPELQALFSGDTLFTLGCGRLFEGTPVQMWHSLQKIRALSDDTALYCGHEYTEFNGNFCLSIEPDNPQLLEKMTRVRQQRNGNLPTVPSLLGEEKRLNPFLRADEPGLAAQLEMKGATPQLVFARLRELKNNFRD